LPTKRAPDAGDSAAISSSFLRLIIFLVGRLRRPRPSAGNANRWVAEPKSKCKTILIRKFVSAIGSKFKTSFLAVAFFKFSAFCFIGFHFINIISGSSCRACRDIKFFGLNFGQLWF
jgi:hypothetical protein